ncbi:hypothetical protein [Helicobacter bizzozeronii]|uniref:hypothetical protein n=1 Tax=Helicobacter bizzozeronii TaxID=56877 RepID=UPI00059EFB35|nr:hypothetical protein [Helicobacter bizzozeronii]
MKLLKKSDWRFWFVFVFLFLGVSLAWYFIHSKIKLSDPLTSTGSMESIAKKEADRDYSKAKEAYKDKDYKKEFEYYKKLADMGDSRGYNGLGVILLLMDERKGRAEARNLSLEVIGTIGVLWQMKEVPHLQSLLDNSIVFTMEFCV